MRDETAKLDGRREGALSALLSEPSIRDAAKKAKLSEATLYRYLREPSFVERYKQARREAIGHLTTRLQAKADASAKVLSDIAEDEGKPASVRVAAAKAVIEYALKAFELGDLGERLKVLEEALKAQKGRGAR